MTKTNSTGAITPVISDAGGGIRTPKPVGAADFKSAAFKVLRASCLSSVLVFASGGSSVSSPGTPADPHLPQSYWLPAGLAGAAPDFRQESMLHSEGSAFEPPVIALSRAVWQVSAGDRYSIPVIGVVGSGQPAASMSRKLISILRHWLAIRSSLRVALGALLSPMSLAKVIACDLRAPSITASKAAQLDAGAEAAAGAVTSKLIKIMPVFIRDSH